jgi:hypothetical protein
MAIQKNYCLYDHVAHVFLNSISFPNDAKAIQWFTTVVNEENDRQAPSLYPESFSLYRLDDFDDKKGEYVPRDTQQQLQANKNITYEELDRKPKQIITGVEVADKVNMKFTMKQLLTALKSDILNQESNDNVVNLSKEVNV